MTSEQVLDKIIGKLCSDNWVYGDDKINLTVNVHDGYLYVSLSGGGSISNHLIYLEA